MTRVTATEEQILRLAEVVSQCLDDMGVSGRSVCGLAKAELRVAYEPFIDDVERSFSDWMSYEAANKIVEDAR